MVFSILIQRCVRLNLTKGLKNQIGGHKLCYFIGFQILCEMNNLGCEDLSDWLTFCFELHQLCMDSCMTGAKFGGLSVDSDFD